VHSLVETVNTRISSGSPMEPSERMTSLTMFCVSLTGYCWNDKLNTLQWSTRILVVVNTLQAKFPQTIWIWTVNCKWFTIINTLLKSIVFTLPFKNNDKNCAWITLNSIFTDTTLSNLCSETQLLISDVRNTILASPYTYFAVPLCLKCIFRNHSLLSIYTIS